MKKVTNKSCHVCFSDTGHSVHEVHGFEFPAKTIFANNLKEKLSSQNHREQMVKKYKKICK